MPHIAWGTNCYLRHSEFISESNYMQTADPETLIFIRAGEFRMTKCQNKSLLNLEPSEFESKKYTGARHVLGG